jgi:hypothetical protein
LFSVTLSMRFAAAMRMALSTAARVLPVSRGSQVRHFEELLDLGCRKPWLAALGHQAPLVEVATSLGRELDAPEQAAKEGEQQVPRVLRI